MEKFTFDLSAFPYVEGTDEIHYEISVDAQDKEDAKDLVESLLEGLSENRWEVDLNEN